MTASPTTMHPADLALYHRNPRLGNVEAIAGSLRANGQYKPIVVNAGTHTGRPNEVLAGNHTLKAIRDLAEKHPDDERWQTVLVHVIDVDDDRAARIVLADNRTSELGTMDDTALAEMIDSLDGDLDGTGYDDEDLVEILEAAGDALLDGEDGEDDGDSGPAATLAERFGVPPFTVLDTRQGRWQDRKRAWRDFGVNSHEGRDGALAFADHMNRHSNWYLIKNQALLADPDITDDQISEQYRDKLRPYATGAGTSVFDPVLAELLTAWFSPTGGRIIDPWAGGSVRGIVAAALGRHYTGCELRTEQVEANEAQWAQVAPTVDADGPPTWIAGDSRVTMPTLDPGAYDFALGCPPYYDLEKYGDDPADLSNLPTAEFDAAMEQTLADVYRLLAEDRFAAFVVGSARDSRGVLRDMRALMVTAAQRVGFALANEAVLLNPVGTAPQRAGRQFTGGRSLVRVHQDVLVFVKGDRGRAARACGDVTMVDLGDDVAEVDPDV